MKILLVVLVLVIGFAAYVRLAPTDPAKWNDVALPDHGIGDYPDTGSFVAVRAADTSHVEALFAAAEDTPRTRLVAGSLAEGRATFETRSLLWGFPDYTTIAVQDGIVTVFGRLRFGKSDMGVNRKRIEGWLASAGI